MPCLAITLYFKINPCNISGSTISLIRMSTSPLHVGHLYEQHPHPSPQIVMSFAMHVVHSFSLHFWHVRRGSRGVVSSSKHTGQICLYTGVRTLLLVMVGWWFTMSLLIYFWLPERMTYTVSTLATKAAKTSI